MRMTDKGGVKQVAAMVLNTTHEAGHLQWDA